MLAALFKIVQWRFALVLMLVSLAGCGDSSSGSQSGDDEDAASAIDKKMAEQVIHDTPMVKIKAGKFVRGSNKEDTEGMQQRYGFATPLYQDEHPQAEVYLDDYWIDVYEVTNKAYKTYILSTRRMMPFAWVNDGYALSESSLQKMDVKRLRKVAVDYFQLDMDTRKMDKPALIAAMLEQQKKLDNLPVGGVNWFNAQKFCQWRSARLPTEEEWEKAARGPDGLEYPWGNEWDPTITNTGEDEEWETGIAPVGSYERNKSPYGVYDLSGNVWEWVDAWYQPYENATYKSDAFGKKNRVIRGGGGGIGHYSISYFYRAATRQFSQPEMESDDVGFRCARDA